MKQWPEMDQNSKERKKAIFTRNVFNKKTIISFLFQI